MKDLDNHNNMKTTLNKNYRIVKVKSGNVVIPIIPTPKYFIGDVVLSEYDVRNLQKEVAIGNISSEVANELEIKDEAGTVFNFREDGVLTNTVKGYDTISKMVLSMLNKKNKNYGNY